MAYLIRSGAAETRYTTRIVGKADADWFIESWFETGTLKYGLLYRIGAEGRIRKAWAATEGEATWTSILVKETPRPVSPEPPSLKKESDEKKQVKGGTYDCRRVDVTLTLGGSEYKSSSWYSKDVWRFQPAKDQPGGLVALETSGASTVLEGKGEDAKPTIPLPKE
jgi:hypothetical protein